MTHDILAAPFTWATGIEDTFIQHARPRLRALDEYELTQHYKLWESDIDLVAETGVHAVRWGIPWHIVQPAPGQWDWEWTDKARSSTSKNCRRTCGACSTARSLERTGHRL